MASIKHWGPHNAQITWVVVMMLIIIAGGTVGSYLLAANTALANEIGAQHVQDNERFVFKFLHQSKARRR
jgi:hypothetical protein